MKQSDLQFNGELLRESILKTFGLNSINNFCTENNISPVALYNWFNGNSRSGPRPDSWKKIAKAFAKKGVTLSISDFYISKSEKGAAEPIENKSKVSEDAVPYVKLTDDITRANLLIAEKNQIIVDQYQEIIALRKEIDELKKRLNET